MANIAKALELLNETYKAERDKGTAFEKLIVLYLKNEPYYKNLYSEVDTFKDWAPKHNLKGNDTGIDLVAQTRNSNEYHAIQCKFYHADYTLSKKDIDSFGFAASSTDFSHRILICTTDKFTKNLKENLKKQPNFTIIDLTALERSEIDFLSFVECHNLEIFAKKIPRDHQKEAIKAALEHFEKADRGQLLMACGTGKTFTSLRIAEGYADKGKKVLFLVPSLALMNQTITEWTQQSMYKLHCYAVCSDSDVGKNISLNEDKIELSLTDLQYPATTNAAALYEAMSKNQNSDIMQVVFCTYHSIDVVHQAQQSGIGAFDLIICDEAHRTTGQAFNDEKQADISCFVRIHDNDYIKGNKRLYMTATPRLFTEESIAKTTNKDITLYSMDNKNLYGEVFYTLPFAAAVKKGLLTDYKVIVLELSAKNVESSLVNLKQFEDKSLNISDATKIIGCWKALTHHPNLRSQFYSTQSSGDEKLENIERKDPQEPMRRAVAFCQVIDNTLGSQKTAKIGSKQIAQQFSEVVEHYKAETANEIEDLIEENSWPETNLNAKCELQHVDGTMSGLEKQSKINWLREDFNTNSCRILTNVRCLSEGVDIPALDAVLFLSPRTSMVEVVQTVGRVMRRAPNKNMGYVILPIVVLDNEDASAVLSKNTGYKTVWQVLCALRAHDDRIGADLQLGALGKPMHNMEIRCYREFKEKTAALSPGEKARFQSNIGSYDESHSKGEGKSNAVQKDFFFAEYSKKICAKAVEKVGDRKYWESIAKDITIMVEKLIANIKAILENHEENIKIFEQFLQAIRHEINDSISYEDAIELLAQHYVTSPIFNAFFAYNFIDYNPIASAIEEVTKKIPLEEIQNDYTELNAFYESVKIRAKSAKDPALREQLIVELYENFYQHAFPKLAQRLGIVFTPIEVVDFMLRMVNDTLKNTFNESLASENTTILDPFTGTGTFITRLLQSNMLTTEQAINLYNNRLFANEIVLLSYYIASVNIESALYNRINLDKSNNRPFPGILLTDTFAMYEAKQDDMVEKLLQKNHARRDKQQQANINVIIGNPPYSKGQKNANDDNQNVKYPVLDSKIAETYVKDCKSTGKNSLYDSYIKAFRWATDRLGDKGIVGFISGSSLLEKEATAGLRKHLAQDFTSLYFINLRGDIRKNMLSNGEAAEGENIFGQGSMTGICISILVRDPKAEGQGKIFYYDIGDNLSTKQKKQKLTTLNILSDIPWQEIIPNKNYEWLNQSDSNIEIYTKFNSYLPLKEKNSNKAIFSITSSGISTSRDAWVYNFSKNDLKNNIQKTITFYNSELERSKKLAEDFIFNNDSTKISWSADLKKNLKRQQHITYNEKNIIITTYRPFTNQYLYYEKSLIERTYQIPKIFPTGIEDNKVIILNGIGSRCSFSVLISDKIVNLDMFEKTQILPLYLYNNNNNNGSFAYDTPEKTYAISNEILKQFQQNLALNINQEDLFYYIYGILHSPCYRKTFAALLKKDLPRIPLANNDKEFQAFAQAGRKLADLHLGFETGELYSKVQLLLNGRPTTLAELKTHPAELFMVEKMSFGKNKNTKEKDLSIINYNKRISVYNIPPQAYNYRICSVSAIEYVMRRQTIKTEPKSGITNNANDYAIETMQNPAYPLELLLRVIHISLKTQEIIAELPKLQGL